MREGDTVLDASMWAAVPSFSSLSTYVYKPLLFQRVRPSPDQSTTPMNQNPHNHYMSLVYFRVERAVHQNILHIRKIPKSFGFFAKFC